MRKRKQANQMPFNFLESQKFSQRRKQNQTFEGKPALSPLLFEGTFF